ncbi:MAG: DinB family protein [Chitinophagales bacterium]
MKISETFISELKREIAITRPFLEAVPEGLAWKPHAKSMAMDRLAAHIAEIPGWTSFILEHPELDFNQSDYVPKTYNHQQLLQVFDDNAAHALAVLSNTADEIYDQNWTMRQGEIIFFTTPKLEVMRTWVMNHLVHHRAQLGMYLRLNDIAVPATYGPSAG